MIDKVGGVILKDKKSWFKEKRTTVQNVSFLAEKGKMVKATLKL